MTRICADCGNPMNNGFGGRRHYCFHAVKVQHDTLRAAQEEQENNEGSAGETPNPQDPTTENENGITEKDNTAQ